jgi:hypothetical protein
MRGIPQMLTARPASPTQTVQKAVVYKSSNEQLVIYATSQSHVGLVVFYVEVFG